MREKEKITAPPERPWVVLLMIFVLLGPLGLPMLWKSPHFSRHWKGLLTVLVCLIAIAAVTVLYFAIAWFIERMHAPRG